MDGLLLIHAFPLDASMWSEQVDALGETVAVVAPDLPGFGEPPASGEMSSMRVAADACVRALDRAGIQHAVVCGLSMGGYVAFELWRSSRDRIAGLVLANTRSLGDTEEESVRRRAVAERVLREGTAGLAGELAPALLGAPTTEVRDLVVRTIAAQTGTAVAAAQQAMIDRPDSTPDLPTIDVPTLVITSSEDRLIPPEVTLPMADMIDGAAAETIDGAGHLSSLEAPEIFTDHLRGHLERCRVD